MAIKRSVQETLREFESTNGDTGKDAVKAVRLYARVTCAPADRLAEYCMAVAKDLEKLSAWLKGNRY